LEKCRLAAVLNFGKVPFAGSLTFPKFKRVPLLNFGKVQVVAV
jgi:hypothetical protein